MTKYGKSPVEALPMPDFHTLAYMMRLHRMQFTNLKAWWNLRERFVECCGKRHYVRRKTEDYRAGLFFCPECSAGYELTIERHKIVEARPFAR